MRIWIIIPGAIAALLTIAMLFMAGWERPPIDSVQNGFRGVGMETNYNPRKFEQVVARNQAPPEVYPLELTGGPLAKDIYENVEVLGDLPEEQFLRLMTAITEWVSPEQGCNYCHSDDGFAAENIYTKIVSRRMLQMTQHINADWQDHVVQTGVTCYTCHRGQPVPPAIWFKQPEPERPTGMVGNRAGQNTPSPNVAMASLPYDPFTPFLLEDNNIRAISLTPLPAGNRRSIKQTEWTYGLMMHMSDSLGVNCSYCHNSRAFYNWEQSPPQRTSAWYGIRMVRALNNDYLVPLGPQYPDNRLGPLGDAPKANCTTCHYGVYKPLFGAQMAKDYPSLLQTYGTQEANAAHEAAMLRGMTPLPAADAVVAVPAAD